MLLHPGRGSASLEVLAQKTDSKAAALRSSDKRWINLGVSHNLGYHFGGPHNKDYNILGSILEYPYFGKLPFMVPTINAYICDRTLGTRECEKERSCQSKSRSNSKLQKPNPKP